MKVAARFATCVAVSLVAACGSSTPADSMGASGTGNASGAGNTAAGGQATTAGASSGGSVATAGSSGAATTAGTGGSSASTAGQTSGGAAGVGGGTGGTGGTNPDQPPEGVPPTYQLVYSQTFAEPASMADLVFANPSQWKHDDAGGFVACTGASYMPPYRSPFSVAIVKAIKVTSFVMDAEMLQTSPDGDGHRDMVFIWNFQNPSQFYYSHISTAHDGVAHNILIVNNADRTAISKTFSDGYDWGRDVWKKLRVVRDVESGDMAVYDLDKPTEAILTANDKTFSDGYVGFGSFDNRGQVRNVKVWAATSTPGAPDFFEPAQ
jgi:hypothetical protein